MSRYLGTEVRVTKVDRILGGAYDRLTILLTTWREDTRLQTTELSDLEQRAESAMSEYAKGGSLAKAREAVLDWEVAVKRVITGQAITDACGTCGRRAPIMVQFCDDTRECSRCMQGYPHKEKDDATR